MCNMTGNSAYDGYGVINIALWGNRSFRKLPYGAKLLFIYLIAGPETQPSGLFPVTTISMRDVVPSHILPDCIETLEGAGLVSYDGNVVWVKGMFESITDAQVLAEAQQQVHRVTGNLADKFKAQHGIAKDVMPDTDMSLLGAVANALIVDASLLDIDTMRAIGKLQNLGFTAEEVSKAFGYPDGLWYKNDWRGQKRQKPNMKNLLQDPGIKALLAGPQATTPLDKLLLVEDVRKALKARKTSVAHEYIAGKHGENVWLKLIARKPWRDWKAVEGDIKFLVYEAIA